MTDIETPKRAARAELEGALIDVAPRTGETVAASYFDVDGTLVKTNLVHPTLFYLMNQPSPWSTARRIGKALLRAPAMAAAELVDRRLFNEALFAAYEGTSEDRLLMLAEEAYDTVVRPNLYPGARDLIRANLDRGHEVVLLSGATDFLLRYLAKHLGASTIIANRLEIKDGYATGRLLRPVVAGPEKARLIREHARLRGYDLDACFAYSDSYSDVPMLSVVGHPAAVNPDGRLERLAGAYHWPIFKLDRKPS
ncbi:MAG: HAD family hydrolase [Deltaproteobacteria bacterium]|nr:HAD family hydrolase [Deltaproteobacteria bacterium]